MNTYLICYRSIKCMRNKLIIAVLFGWIAFSACQKELSESFNAYPNDSRNDTIWTHQPPANAPIFRMAEEFFPDLVIDSFDCGLGYTFTDPEDSYTEIIIAPHSFRKPDGGSVGAATGRVQIAFFRIKTRGDYIKFFKPTHTNQYLLDGAGGCFIRVTQNGQELQLLPGSKITIRYKDTEDPKPNMQVFNATESTPPLLKGLDPLHNWLPELANSQVHTWSKVIQNETVAGYELITNHLRWVSINRYLDSNAAHTPINAYLPPNFTNKNTMVYAVFANSKTVVALKPDYASRTFMALRIPRGTKLKVVSFSLVGQNLYLGVKEVNDVGMINAYKIIPERKSLPDILNFLKNL